MKARREQASKTPARPTSTRKRRAPEPPEVAEADRDPRLRGTVVFKLLDAVRPNPWNPNRMTPRERASLRKGLEDDGWVIAFSLLVWGTDETGARRDLIIDGEHRWTEARALGFTNGPMVFLDGLTEAEAKALTIKFIERRGHSEDLALGVVLRSLPADLLDGTSLGLDDERLLRLTSIDPANPPARFDPAGAWAGMPEFDQQDKSAFRRVVVNFKTQADVDAFVVLIGQGMTDKTRSLWYPEAEIERCMDKVYAHGEA